MRVIKFLFGNPKEPQKDTDSIPEWDFAKTINVCTGVSDDICSLLVFLRIYQLEEQNSDT